MLTLLLLACAASLSAAFPVGEWHPPGPGDHRSPCPGLNALANHGYLNRNGQNIKRGDIESAAYTALGVGYDVTSIATINANIAAKIFSGPGGVMVSLRNLTSTHNVIEHDASLSRSDKALGDFVTVNATLVNALVRRATNLKMSDIAAARTARIQDSLRRNKQFTWGIGTQQPVSAAESAFLTTIFGHWNVLHLPPQIGEVPSAYLNDFLINERLPTALGWTPRSFPVTTLELGPISAYFLTQELIATGMAASEAAIIAEASVKKFITKTA